MDNRQLRHFVAVAQERQFTRAAQRLNIVQSALSASIASLEEELDLALFIRTTRSVSLTPAGAHLLEKAIVALDAMRDVKVTAASIRSIETGRLAIGSVQSVPALIDIAGLLARYHDRHPGVRIGLRQMSRETLMAQVAEGSLDLAFMPASPLPRALSAITVTDEPMLLACRASDPLAGERALSIDALAGRKFIDFQPGWGTRSLIDEAFLRAGITRETAFEVSDLATLMAMVEAGLGIALVPAHRHQSAGPSVMLRPLRDMALRWRTILIHARETRSRALSSAARAFLDLLPQRSGGN